AATPRLARRARRRTWSRTSPTSAAATGWTRRGGTVATAHPPHAGRSSPRAVQRDEGHARVPLELLPRRANPREVGLVCGGHRAAGAGPRAQGVGVVAGRGAGRGGAPRRPHEGSLPRRGGQVHP